MAANSKRDRELDRYRGKRDASRTPEPFGSSFDAGTRPKGRGVFVVQKHAARRTHFDFRLELGGVLESWAVPHGPSVDPNDKRLAIHVEAHPLEYSRFEGIIPKGNYGAGAVILWDRGTWAPVGDPLAGLKSGKLLFDLMGYKLRGRWTLVRTDRSNAEASRQWLLIKKADGHSGADRALAPHSVLSGLTLEELQTGASTADELKAELARLGAVERSVNAKHLQMMLCQSRPVAFSDDAWIYELKYDGYRLLAEAAGGRAYLRYRRGSETTSRFPEIAEAIAALPYEQFVVDGEVAVFDDDGKANFGRLQQRAMLSRSDDIGRAMLIHPVRMAVFDLLFFAGYDLRDLPLLDRKRLLKRMLPTAGPLRYVDYIVGRGEDFYSKVMEIGLEGIVAKKASAPYRGGRSELWCKIRGEQTNDFAIAGYRTKVNSSRSMSSLHLVVRDKNRWCYAGRVGSGFDEAELATIQAMLDALPRWRPTFERPEGTADTWVKPTYVCTVRYLNWSQVDHLRQPVFLHLRPDKAANECVRVETTEHPDSPSDVPELATAPAPVTLRLTNVDKVFWPEHGYTKGDLIGFYRDIAPWLMPYLVDRPVVMTRYPDGIGGKSFFQKDAPEWVPEWVRTEVMWSERAQRTIHYFVCDEPNSVVYLANLGTIPLHVWASRIATLATPDWCTIDLDPKSAPFDDVIRCARAVRKLCAQIELPCFVKTSGATGLHIMIPLAQQFTHEQSRTLAHLICRVVETRHRDIATTNRLIEGRAGRVYLDYAQNGHGRLLAAPYSVRPRPKATVSTPLHWREVTSSLQPDRFTIRTVLRRVRRQKRDPLHDVLSIRPDLQRSLRLLSEYVTESKNGTK